MLIQKYPGFRSAAITANVGINRAMDPVRHCKRLLTVGLLLGVSSLSTIAAEPSGDSSLTIAKLIERSEQLSASAGEVLPAPVARDTLDLPDEPPSNAVVRQRPTSANWLDIRARSIDSSARQLVPQSDRPNDTSGLPDLQSAGLQYVHHQPGVLRRDFYQSSLFCHRPLYFEDPYLERCGKLTACLHRVPSIHSTAQFLWKTSGFPLSLAFDPPWQRHASGFRTPYWIRTSKHIREGLTNHPR